MNKYLLEAYNVAGSILRSRDRTVNKIENVLVFIKFIVWEEKTKPKRNKYTIYSGSQLWL